MKQIGKIFQFIDQRISTDWFFSVILILLSISIYHRWFLSGIVSHSDLWFQYPETLQSQMGFYLWQNIFSLGDIKIASFIIPLIVFSGFLSFFLSIAFVHKLIFLYPTVFLLPLTSYLFLKKLTNSSGGSLLGSLIISYNTYFLTIISEGHLNIPDATAFGLLSLYFILKSIPTTKRYISTLILAALSLAVCGIYDFRIAYIFFGVIALIYIFSSPFKLKHIRSIFYKYFATALLFVALNSFWFIGTISTSQFSNNGVLDRQLFGDQYWGILHSITLHHPFWTGTQPEWFSSQPIPFYFWIIPFLAFLGFIVTRKNSYTALFAFIGLLGIFLTKQSDAPIETFYAWLYANLPGFNAFREATKFFVLVALAYAVSIAFLYKSLQKFRKYLLICIFLSSAILIHPVITGHLGAIMTPKKIPTDYIKFNQMVSNQQSYFRTIWVPMTPRWSSANARNSSISASNLFRDNWSNISEDTIVDKFFYKQMMDRMTYLTADEYFDTTSAKYVVLPLRDTKTNDDFFTFFGGATNKNIRQWYIDQLDTLPYLKRIDIGTEELAVYENEGYLPYVRTGTSLIEYENSINLENKYLFTRDILNFPFGFVVPKDTKLASYPQTTIFHLYENIAPTNIRMGAITTKPNTDSESETLYVNTNAHSIEYTRDSNSLVFYKKYAPGIRLGGGNNSIDAHLSKKAVLAEVPTTNNEYIGVQSGSILSLQQTESSKHLASTKNMTVYRVEKINAITNASFENGLWQETVGDCNNHDDNPILDMSLSSTAYRSSSSLELMATRHIACTNTYTEPLEAGSSYLFSFAYQGDPAQQAGFHLSFGKGMDTNTVVSERLPISEVGNKWQEFSRILRVPEGAERAQLHLYAYATDNETANIVRYDAIRFAKIQEVAQVGLGEQEPNFEAIPLPSQESYEFTFSDPAYSMENLISNPSLEDGLWSKRVGDCNNHDDNPILDMRLSDIASDNNHSIELSATRHIACTGPRSVPVTNGSRYLLSFDYQGEGAKEAGYYIGFSGSNSPPSKNERIVISKDAERSWKTYTKIIDVPEGAQNASLLVYAYATNGKQKNIVRYDNFSLIELPPIHNRYYLVSDPETNFVEPREITFDLINPTKKLVHIKGATTPFYLAMSESYHPEWQAHLSNAKIGTEVKSEKSKVKSKNESFDSELSTESSSLSTFDLGLSTFYSRFFASWIPWVKPDAISNDHHFELNGFLNGWYVDSSALCAEVPRTESQLPSTANTEERGTRNSELRSGCTQNPDGSYDIELTLEFFPQRWFYLGLLISGTTLLACLGYLAYDFARRRRAKRKSKVASPKSKGEIDRDRTV